MGKSYWVDALFVKGNEILEGQCGRDGLMVKLDWRDFEIQRLLAQRPNQVEGGVRCWYFNNTYDRQIAEQREIGSLVINANPQLLWQDGWEIVT